MEIGFLLWGFILIGNAVALVALSKLTEGSTSTMSGSRPTVRRH